MSHSLHISDQTMHDIIDGIDECDISPQEKIGFLKRIESEGGIESPRLRNDLIVLFDSNALVEKEHAESANVLQENLAKAVPEKLDDPNVAAQIVEETGQQQQEATDALAAMVAKMKHDTQALEGHYAKTIEVSRRSEEAQTMDGIREKLQQDSEGHAFTAA